MLVTLRGLQVYKFLPWIDNCTVAPGNICCFFISGWRHSCYIQLKEKKRDNLKFIICVSFVQCIILFIVNN